MPPKTATQPKPAPAGPDIALHMLMNDSAPVLLDWVLHHHHAGFRSITVHGDVFGHLVSRGGAILLHHNLVGGSARNADSAPSGETNWYFAPTV